MDRTADYVVRDYATGDEPSWLRCRILAFLTTAYFDDVVSTKPDVLAPGFGLVAVTPHDTVVGLMDVAIEDTAASIDTLAVHPDHQYRGIARSLLSHALSRVRVHDVTAISAGLNPHSSRCALVSDCVGVELDDLVGVVHACRGSVPVNLSGSRPRMRCGSPRRLRRREGRLVGHGPR